MLYTTGKHPYYNRKTPLLQQENTPPTTGKHPYYNRKTSLLQQESHATTLKKHAPKVEEPTSRPSKDMLQPDAVQHAP
ncbi:MAG: hypothetical protein ILA04_05470 [Prevotella sp.]|nr:hypothetical protein [Prevotella sp.]